MLLWIISANILIIAILICRRLLKGRVWCGVRYALWLLVALRLLIPVSPLSNVLSVDNLLPESWTAQEGLPLPVNSPAAGGTYSQPMGNLSLQPVNKPHADRSDNTSVGKPYQETATFPVEKEEAKLHVETVVGAIWLAGSCALALWLVAVNGIFRYKVSRSRKRIDNVKHLQRQLTGGKGRLLPVYVTQQVNTPCMYGLLRPAIYVTPMVADDLWLLAMVLRHEHTHYRHGDHIWAVVRALCLCVHWFNPLVWVAVRLSRQDGELACDEGVLRQLDRESRVGYGEALLALSTGEGSALHRSMNLATSMSGTKRQLKERLSTLVTMPRMAAGTAVLVVLLAMVLVACTFTSRADEGQGEESNVMGKAAVERSARVDRGEHEDAEVAGQVADGRSAKSGDGENEDPEQESSQPDDADTQWDSNYWMPWVVATCYTGYLDEIGPSDGEWDYKGRDLGYRNQDYDGDGLIDRIYQDVESEPGVMKMRVEFGNGEVLAFDTYESAPLVVQSLDLDGDGSRELLFTKPIDFSTSPVGTDILLFTRQGQGYRQVEISMEEPSSEYYGLSGLSCKQMLSVSCRKADDSHIQMSWKVPGGEGDLGKTQIVLRPMDEEEMEYYVAWSLGGKSQISAHDAELIQERYAFLRLYFEGLYRSGDEIWVDLGLEDGELHPVNSVYVQARLEDEVNVNIEPEPEGAAHDNWDVQVVERYDENGNPKAEITDGEIITTLTYVETPWSLSAKGASFSQENLYWAYQALLELEQWTGTRVTECCYNLTRFGEFTFSQTPEDMEHSRIFYSRSYNCLLDGDELTIESVDYSTDMDVWFSPVKQYVTPPQYDKMTVEEILTWYFERSALSKGSRVEEIFQPYEGSYTIRTDQGTYYEFLGTDDLGTVGRGMALFGPYDSYPLH